MRVIDCNECGETLQAANDAELTGALCSHFSEEHEALDREDAEEIVAEQAYEATDS